MHELGFTFRAMASRCEVRLCADDEAQAQRWAQAAIDEVRRIEAKFSRYTDDSVTTRINRAAGGPPLPVDDETAALLDFGATLWASSDGRFDLTSGVLRRAWRFDLPRLPAQEEIDALRAQVGWSGVRWERDARRLQLPRDGMEIDFGGLGKEYAADRAAGVLLAAGVRHGFVNLGGDVRAIGPAPDGAPWRIGIQHPRGQAGATMAAIDLVTEGLATSGDYERYIEVDEQRYCHILDPRTGWPTPHWQSVSVVAPVCAAAGACSTVAMLMPRDEALAFLREQGVGFLAVDAAGEVWRSG
jgi:thiamine biosynthesis lipoprotein